MNIVALVGNVASDVEIRTTSGDSPTEFAQFSIAVSRAGKDAGTDFIHCVAFGKRAKTIGEYVKKGQKLAVQGSWSTGSYTTQDGRKVYTNKCLVSNFTFCSSRQQSGDSGTGLPQMPPDSDGFMNIPDGLDEDLPFNV